MGLSVDGLYSHIAWLRNIKEKIEFRGMKDVEVKEDMTCHDWFFCTKKLDKRTVLDRVLKK